MWLPDELLKTAVETLRREEQRLVNEQAVHGIDRYSEVELHGIIATGFLAQGHGAFRECLYPCAASPHLRRSERQRCDVVLTPSADRPPLDPTEVERAAAAARGTLFAHEPAVTAGDSSCPCEEAYWLEVKLVGQFTFSRGVPIPNTTYASELMRGMRADLDKLTCDPMIRCGAAMLILFNADDRIAEHDIEVLRERTNARASAPFSFLASGFRIADRIGNQRCTVVLASAR